MPTGEDGIPFQTGLLLLTGEVRRKSWFSVQVLMILSSQMVIPSHISGLPLTSVRLGRELESHLLLLRGADLVALERVGSL